MLRFTSGERKICLTIKKPQNIMNVIVGDMKLSVKHTFVNSKRISKILECFFHGPCIRNENMQYMEMLK